jgi:2-keto-4-pentenoate hydratase
MDEADIADMLWRARAERTTIPPLRYGDLGIDAAYRIQSINIARAGRRRIGRKIGLTSEAIQRQLSVDQPDVGVLSEGMDVSGDDMIDIRRLVQPRIEAEVAFVLARPIPDGADLREIETCIDYATVAAEIVDSVIKEWRITLFDTVADNASAGLFALGEQRIPLSAVQPALVVMSMQRGQDTVSEGDGRACLGDPLNALAWLARTSADQGRPLQAGEIILSGALGPMVRVAPGDVFDISVAPLGRLQVAFSA